MRVRRASGVRETRIRRLMVRGLVRVVLRCTVRRVRVQLVVGGVGEREVGGFRLFFSARPDVAEGSLPQ